jgi:hypothetical protein
MAVMPRFRLNGFGQDPQKADDAERFTSYLHYGWNQRFNQQVAETIAAVPPWQRISASLAGLLARIMPTMPTFAYEVPEAALAPVLIYGAGLLSMGDLEGAVVLMDQSVAPTSPTDLREVPEALKLVGSLLDGGEEALPSTVFCVGITPPRIQCGPGHEVIGRLVGTMGMFVTTGPGQPGVLTAGHVGAPLNAVVNCQGQPIGRVVFTSDPAQHAQESVTADVAVIELMPHWMPTEPLLAIRATGAAVGGEIVQSFGARTSDTANVMSRMPWLKIPSVTGQLADTYMLTKAISVEGDSGAPVLLEGTDKLIGHVVAGAGTMTSFVQAVDTQLTACGAQERFVT